MVANLNIRVRTDNRMSLGATQSRGIFEAAGERTTEVSLEDLAVGILHQTPGVISIAVLGQVPIYRVLAKGDDSVDLLLGVGET